MNQGRFDQDNRSGRSGHFNHDDKRPWFGEGQRGSRQGSERSERYRSGSYEDESGYGQSSRGRYGGERGDRDFDDDRFGRSSTEFGDHSGSQGSRGGRGFQPGRGFQESGREFESGRHGGGSGSDAYQGGGYQTGGYQAGGYPSGGNQGGYYRSGGYQGSGYQSGGYPGGGYQGERFQGSEYQEGGSQSRGRSGGFGSPSWGGNSEWDSGSGATEQWGRGRNLFGRPGNQQSFVGKGPKDYKRSDERIREDVSDRLTDDDSIDASEVTVQVQSGEVTLTGTVNDRQQKRRAEDVAEQITGVKEVINNLRISRQSGDGQQSSFGEGRDKKPDTSKTTTGKTGAVS